jgi:hypothetical protein
MCQQVEEEEKVLPHLLVHLQLQVVLEADLLDVLEEAGDAPEEQAPAQRPGAADEARNLLKKNKFNNGTVLLLYNRRLDVLYSRMCVYQHLWGPAKLLRKGGLKEEDTV